MADPVLAPAGDGRWTVSGALDFNSVEGLLAQARSIMRRDGDAEIDLEGVTRADSAGLALLVEWLRESERRGASIRFVNVPEQMKQIARVCGLEDILSL